MDIKSILTKQRSFLNLFNVSGWGFGVLKRNRGYQQPFITTPYTTRRTFTSETAMAISSVKACVQLISNTIASLPIKIYEGSDPITNSPLVRLLTRRPNRHQSTFDFIEDVVTNYLLNGNTYILITKAAGQIVNLVTLPAEQVEVKLLESGALQYRYVNNAMITLYDEPEIIHIRGLGNGVMGLNPLSLMNANLNLAADVTQHSIHTVMSGRRAGVLTSKNILTDDVRKKLKANFNEIKSEDGTANNLFLLEADLDYKPMGMSATELQLDQIRKDAHEEICRFFLVPPVLVQNSEVATKLGSSTQTVIEQFYKTALHPLMTKIERALENKLLSERQKASGFHIEFLPDSLLRMSKKDRYEIYSKAVQNGLATRNEVRANENMPPVEDDLADVLTVQANLVPIDKLGEQNAFSESGVSETEDQETIKQ